MESTENWRPIPGYEGCYEVSDQGRVRSLPRVVPHKRYGEQPIAGRILSTSERVNPPYFSVQLLKLGRQKTYRVHVLVLEVFSGPRPAGMVARHLNGDSFDNRAVNLEWGTQGENLRDAARHGTHYQVKKTHCPRGHALRAPNLDPGNAKQGHRSCRSCTQERWAARDQRREFDPARADERYAKMMGGSA